MTAPDPLTAHTAAAMGRVIDAMRGDRPVPPTVALPLIRNRIRQVRTSGACSVVDKVVLGIIDDLADVVEQLAGQMGGAS